MSLTAKIAYNTAVQTAGKTFSVAFGLVSVALLLRYLGTAGYGNYVTAITFVQFFGVVADMGLYMVSIKRISQRDAELDHIFGNIFTLRLVSALFFVGLAPLVVLFFPYPAIVKTGVLVVTGMNLFVALNQLLVGLYQKELTMSRASMSEVLGKLLTLGMVALAVALHQGLFFILFAFVVGAFLQLLLSLFFARRFVRLRLRFDWAVWRSVLEESWPIAVTIALNIIYFRADTIMLAIFKTQSIVGIYGAGYKVLEVLIAFPAMFAGLMMPLVTRAYADGDHERFAATLQKGFDFLAMVALPMVAGVFLLAHPLMRLLSGGSDFDLSGSILRVLIFATGSIFFGVLFGNTVVSIGRQRKVIPLYAAVAAGSLVGYGLLIPRFSMWGAAAVTVATELAITVGSFLVVWSATRIRISLRQFGKTLIAVAIMAAVLWLGRGMNLFLIAGIGAATYIAALFAVGGMNRAMIREVIQLR